MALGATAAIASLAAHLVLCDAVTSYDLGLYTETRGRFRPPADSGELDVSPRASLISSGPMLGATLSYSPRIFTQGWSGSAHVLHRAAWDAAWRVDRAWSVTAAASGSYGINDLLLAPSSTTGSTSGVQLVPQLSQLQYASGDTSLGVAGQISPRSRIYLNLGGFTDGGLGSAAEKELPRERGGRAAGGFTWDASRNDMVGAEARSSLTALTLGRRAWVIELLATWRRALRQQREHDEGDLRLGIMEQQAHERDSRSEVWLTLGSAGTASSTRGQTAWSGGASTEAGVRIPLAGRDVEGMALARFTPQVDRFTGALNERLAGEARFSWHVNRVLAFMSSGNAGVVVGGVGAGQRVVTTELRVAWTPSPTFEATAGGRGWWQHEVQNTVPSFHELTAFVGLAFHQTDRLRW